MSGPDGCGAYIGYCCVPPYVNQFFAFRQQGFDGEGAEVDQAGDLLLQLWLQGADLG